EGHAHRGNGPGLNDEKQSPAVEKPPQRSQRFAQVNVLATGPRHHRGKLSITEGANDGQETGYQPGSNKKRRGTYLSGNFRGNDENTRANHGTHYQHGGAG